MINLANICGIKVEDNQDEIALNLERARSPEAVRSKDTVK